MADPLSFVLRSEDKGDAAAVRALVREAFVGAPHAGGNEHEIVDALRAAGQLAISLVAEIEQRLVGYVAISPIIVEDGTSDWYGLGPIAVAPAFQRRGIGGALMMTCLPRLWARGGAGCVLLGDPAYYRRFGFQPAAPLVLPGVPHAFFQARLFAGQMPRGRVRYHEAFGV